MEPHPRRDEEGAVIDTGQSAAAASAEALSTGEGDVNRQDGLRDAPLSAAALEGKCRAEATVPAAASPTGSESREEGSLEDLAECDGTASDSQASIGSKDRSGASGDAKQDCVEVKPKINVELENQESREVENSNDDDMDPLITIDDTESQISDLISFDTVSYDVIDQPAAEDDDDEKSIATVSSLSCDFKMNSPLKQSDASNASSLINLLDSSVKETSGLTVSPSDQMFADDIGSASRSCSSSPSFRSSKTMSSALDESISEALMNVVQIGDDNVKIVVCDHNILSQEDLGTKGRSKVNMQEPVDVGTLECLACVAGSLFSEDFGPDAIYEGNSETQVTVPGADSSRAQCESTVAVMSTGSPSLLEFSYLCNQETCTEMESSEPEISSQFAPCLNVHGANSMTECDNFVLKSEVSSGNHIRAEPVKVPDDVAGKSLEGLMNALNVHEEPVVVPASMEMNESQDTLPTTNLFAQNPKTEDKCCHVLDNNMEHTGEENLPAHSTLSCDKTIEDSEISSIEIKDKNLHNMDYIPDINDKENISALILTSKHLMQSVPTKESSDDTLNILEKEETISIAVSSTTEENVKLAGTSEKITPVPLSLSAISVNSCTMEDSNSTPSETAGTTIQEDNDSSFHTSFVNEGTSLEENTTAVFLLNEETIPESTNNLCGTSQSGRTPSAVDSAVSVSNCVNSEESMQLISCNSSNETAGVSALEATSVMITEISSPAEKFKPNNECTKPVSEHTYLQTELTTQDNSDYLRAADSHAKSKIVEISGNASLSESEGSELKENLCSEEISQSETCCLDNVLNSAGEPFVSTNCLQTAFILTENVDARYKRPTTLPDINLHKVTSGKSCSMNFSDFLSHFHAANVECSFTSKQYDVAALDDAQQMASFLVDDILQTAILKAEEKLIASKSLAETHVEVVQAAWTLVDEVLSVASAHLNSIDGGKAENSTTCDIKDNGCDHSVCSSNTEDSYIKVTDSAPSHEVNAKISEEELSSAALEESSPEPGVKCMKHVQPITEELCQEIHISPCNTSSEMALCTNYESTSENINRSGDSSLSGSFIDIQSKEESTRTSSTENGGVDSARSSLFTASDVGLRSEASLFVNGILEEAVKKYEESSSSDSSPLKVRSLALDAELFQEEEEEEEEEELATPCGEMLTEHFMDFESGRNVSVFCSVPESGSKDHLMAYDRIAHTIGNREVDSDTGKSVSVFRIEEDVYYEIQRASTCTSVFESVEEEDEDMIDTTLPVEDRPEKALQTSVSFPSYDKDKQAVSDDLFTADCDAFEDAVGAFLSKERSQSGVRKRDSKVTSNDEVACEQQSDVTCRALILRHPEYDISNSEEKKRMAEKWANGGESEVPDTPEMREKQRAIREALDSDDDVAVKLCRLALTEGGLINDALRREAWPRMLGLDPTLEVDAPSLEDLKSHPEYGQVVLDVNRSLKRFPPDIPKDRRETLQDKLTRLIMYVISKHPHLRYYQGYHDVAVTFLLVVGESIAFQIMERLSTEHLSDCMQPTMERTSYLLHFIYPLLHRLHPTLADYLERSEVGTMFCLPWFLTWFGHSLDRYQDVVRLYDHFLASPPLAPLYVAAVLVAHRADEVLAVDCDMAAIHALLSHIPDSLPLEILLHDATDLYLKFPPESIEREVEERFRNEQDMRVQEMEARERVQRQRALRRRRGHSQGSGSWQLAEFQDRIGGMMVLNRWIPPWVVQQQRLSMRLLFASATFFVGFYVYSRGGDMLPYP